MVKAWLIDVKLDVKLDGSFRLSDGGKFMSSSWFLDIEVENGFKQQGIATQELTQENRACSSHEWL